MEVSKQLWKFTLFISLGFCFQLANSQEKVNYNDALVKKEINNILVTHSNIDSIHLQFFQNKPSKLEIFEKNNVEKFKEKPYGRRSYFYDLSFEGDKLLLTKEFPSIAKLLKEDIAMAIQKPQSLKNFKFVIGSNYSELRDSLPIYGLYATITPQRKKELQGFLNLKYKESLKKIEKDSILFFQGVVDRGGNLGQIELLKGSRGALYQYFFNNYQYYIKNVFNQTKKSPRESFILPALLNGKPFRSLIDIYVRLNPNNTITISGNGIQRKLRIQDYKENKAEPLIWW